MGIGQALGPLWRRWYLAVLGLLLSAGLGYAGWVLTPPAYEATGSVLLLPSREQMASGGRNPFLQLGNLDAPASIVIARLNGDETQNLIEAASPTAEYLVQNDPTLRGPGIQVIVSDRSEENALAILDQLLDLVGASLTEVQAEREVPSAAVVGSMRLVVDTEAERLTSATVRTAVAAVGIGVVATALLVYAADALILRRQRARQAKDTRHKDGSSPSSGGPIRREAPRTPSQQRPKARPIGTTRPGSATSGGARPARPDAVGDGGLAHPDAVAGTEDAEVPEPAAPSGAEAPVPDDDAIVAALMEPPGELRPQDVEEFALPASHGPEPDLIAPRPDGSPDDLAAGDPAEFTGPALTTEEGTQSVSVHPTGRIR